MAKKGKLNEKGVPFGAREKMPMWYSMIWSTRGISAAINVVILMQITYYCTDILPRMRDDIKDKIQLFLIVIYFKSSIHFSNTT